MHLDIHLCVLGQINMPNIITVGFGYFVSDLGLFDCFPSIHTHLCMLHNS